MGELRPSVGVVVPTRDRPELLRETLAGIAAQTYDGPVEIVVVYDGTAPDMSLEDGAVRVITNDRRPGLAGARNSGLLALETDLVAFCDDDDVWSPDKLLRQVARLSADPGAELVTCAIAVGYDGRRTPRLAGTDTVELAHLTRSRMSMLHSSTLLFDRSALIQRIGLVDEDIPGSQNEDWDLLLRAVKSRSIAHVDEPLVEVRWGRTSMFARAWETKVTSLLYMLDAHPEIRADRRGLSRVEGQLAFGEAAGGKRRASIRWAGRALVHDPLQWRAVAALMVAAGLVSADRVLDVLHRFGRGV